ncbi:MAG: sugar ABC transporter ATP-binding protein [Chloroflexi bacterium]|nr:sugar ABC transporter ATP-binding protein [Chloroflexota bacterium]
MTSPRRSRRAVRSSPRKTSRNSSRSGDAAVTAQPIVEARGISKRFQAVQALDDVNVIVNQGEIHALVGENGAGKSTLGKVISGIVRADAGTLLVKGRPVSYSDPHAALQDGITTISQEISLLTRQTVLENVLLGQEIVRSGLLNRRAMLQRFEELQALAGFSLDPDARVGQLRAADQKKVEVMQAIARNADLVVMDEPTAMLPDNETVIFLDMVRRLKAMGRTIIFISHFLQEVLDLADSVTVMRNGRTVRTARAADETPDSLVTAMLGKSIANMYPPRALPPPDAPVVYRVSGLTSSFLSPVSIQIRAGEIVGMAGLVGSGRSRLARTLFGAEPATGGRMEINGQVVTIRSPSDAIKAGIYLLPESRKEQGLLLKQTARQNVTLPHLGGLSNLGGWLHSRRESREVVEILQSLNVQPHSPNQRVSRFSGGNQQKVLFSKWLLRRPTVFMIDEPTRGIDVGAKQSIYQLIADLAAQGMAILLISSEIEEILGLAHRVLVMRLGQIVAEVQSVDGELNQSAIMRAAFGAETHADPLKEQS